MARDNVAPERWRNDIKSDIKQSVAISTETDAYIKDSTDEDRSLRTLRAFLLVTDNEQLHEYFRDVRELIVHLRHQLQDVNNETKSTLRTQNKLEHCLDDLRKDNTLSSACTKLRTLRPGRERDFGIDKIDDLLGNERMRQGFLKKSLQELLQSTIAQVNELTAAAAQLKTVIAEREKVLGYISCSIAGVEHRKSIKKRTAIVVNNEEYTDDVADLPCYNAEADEALRNGDHVKRLARTIRKRVKEEIERTKAEQKQIHADINITLRNKTTETRQFKAKLTMQIGKNRLALHRAERGVHLAKQSFGKLAGPEMSGDLTTRERANRNIVKSFERHFPASVSEHETAQIQSAKKSLAKSIEKTNNNLKILMQAQEKLKKQLRDKTLSEQNETCVSRYRRQKADHRWVIDEPPVDHGRNLVYYENAPGRYDSQIMNINKGRK